MQSRPLITRVVLENYKSIAFCDVKLGPLSILVGPNGAGKSNFLDALRFLSEAMNGPIEKAFHNRGGFSNVIRRGMAYAGHLGIRIEFRTAGVNGYYSIRFERKTKADYSIQRERCLIASGSGYQVQNGIFVVSDPDRPGPPLAPEHLYLPFMAAYPEFTAVHKLLSQLRFYNLHPKEFLQPANDQDSNRLLSSDARNLANVLNYLRMEDLLEHGLASAAATKLERVLEYLKAINPALTMLTTQAFGGFRSLEFFLNYNPDAFRSNQMSDGTLRSLAVLVALFQVVGGVPEISLVGLEEPEAAVHPAAAGVLFDAMREASASVQVVATTHSADLLDKNEIDTDAILAVELHRGITQIGHIDETGRQALKKRLYTAGELMRMNYLRPESSKTPDDSEIESVLFGDLVPA